MAFLPFDEHGNALLAATRSAPAPAPSGLSPLEWSVVRLARNDRPGSLDAPGRFRRWFRAALRLPNPQLADDRLEALRRMAVLTWHHGLTVPGREVAAFLAAGFTPDQYEAVTAAVGAVQLGRR